MRSKVAAVVPALNESTTISGVVKGLKEKVGLVVVVDDGSSDNTSEIAKKSGAIVVRHVSNSGYDSALNSGFAIAFEKGAEIIMTFDADGQHKFEEIKSVLEPIISGDADVVVGTRPGRKKLSEKFLMMYSKRKAGVPDILCGLKAYKREVYHSAGCVDSVGSIGTELVFHARKKGYRVKATPITLNEREDNSRFYRQIFVGNYRIFRANWKLIRKFGL
jgi:glycosyltransferase involved in cell wall biosynthesis